VAVRGNGLSVNLGDGNGNAKARRMGKLGARTFRGSGARMAMLRGTMVFLRPCPFPGYRELAFSFPRYPLPVRPPSPPPMSHPRCTFAPIPRASCSWIGSARYIEVLELSSCLERGVDSALTIQRVPGARMDQRLRGRQPVDVGRRRCQRQRFRISVSNRSRMHAEMYAARRPRRPRDRDSVSASTLAPRGILINGNG